jgi:hypothetical protein
VVVFLADPVFPAEPMAPVAPAVVRPKMGPTFVVRKGNWSRERSPLSTATHAVHFILAGAAQVRFSLRAFVAWGHESHYR